MPQVRFIIGGRHAGCIVQLIKIVQCLALRREDRVEHFEAAAVLFHRAN